MAGRSRIHKVRIICTGLAPHLSGERLLDALMIWESGYASSPSVSVQRYLREIKEKVDLNMDVRAVLADLIRVGDVPESELLDDPSKDIEAYKFSKESKGKEQYRHPDLAIFVALILSWRKALTTLDNNCVYEFVADNIGSFKVDENIATSFLVWLRVTNTELRAGSAQTEDFRHLLNLFYVASCECIGPVKSDALLKRVVQTVKAQYPQRAETVDRLL